MSLRRQLSKLRGWRSQRQRERELQVDEASATVIRFLRAIQECDRRLNEELRSELKSRGSIGLRRHHFLHPAFTPTEQERSMGLTETRAGIFVIAASSSRPHGPEYEFAIEIKWDGQWHIETDISVETEVVIGSRKETCYESLSRFLPRFANTLTQLITELQEATSDLIGGASFLR